MHLLVEANGEKSLAKGMNGLGVRVARGLNRVMGRKGHVLEERYHGHILKTPAEVKNARAYQLGNAQEAHRARGRRSVHVDVAARAAGDVPSAAAVLRKQRVEEVRTEPRDVDFRAQRRREEGSSPSRTD